MKEPLRMRQIHLDFHTSEHIGDVGADWDADAFVDTLKCAHVNSITCFARCHHGLIYYLPTKFAAVHPALKINLLGEQIEACHRAGIRAPIYITVGLDEYMAAAHPEWLEVTPEGVRGGTSPLAARWKKMCLNAPYLDYAWEQTEEVLDLFGSEVDGFFFDIIHQGECVCPYCLASMTKAGLNPESSEDRQRFAQQVLDRYRRRFAEGVWARRPDATVFHNHGHIPAAWRNSADTFSHLEVESLPSTGFWGYNHFPITVRYARTWGLPTMGMTGKFQTTWGDFGSFKSERALEYECFQMLANGAVCSIGDQLHPRGRLNQHAYEMIGRVYERVEALEPWCVGAQPQTEIAVFNVEAVGTHDSTVDTSNSGVLRMLMESHHQFDFVDAQSDWNSYRVLILPDKVLMDASLADKVRAYLEGGGKVIASHRSGLRPEGNAFALPEFGVYFGGDAPFSPDYITVRPEMHSPLADTEYVMYDQGLKVLPHADTTILADVWAPYFNRAWNHFCSHQHTPPAHQAEAGYPAVTLNAAGNVLYLAHPIFAGYRRQAPLWYKQLFLAALQRFLPDPLLECEAPSSAQALLLRQPEEGRAVVHLLHYIPERRGQAFDTIEDVIPLYNVRLAFKTNEQPKRVYLAPSGEELEFSYESGYVRLTVPEVVGYQVVVAE